MVQRFEDFSAEAFFAVFEEGERLRQLACESQFSDYRIPSDDDVTVIDELGLADKVSEYYEAMNQISDDMLSPEQLRLREHRQKGYGRFVGRNIAVTALQNCRPFLKVSWNNANHIKVGRSNGNYEPIRGTLVTPPEHAQPQAFYMRSEHIPSSALLLPIFKRVGLLEVWPIVPEIDLLKRQVKLEFID